MLSDRTAYATHLSELEQLFNQINTAYKATDYKPGISEATMATHNYLGEVKKEIIKLMVLAAEIAQAPQPTLVTEYLRTDRRDNDEVAGDARINLHSSPAERKEVQAYLDKWKVEENFDIREEFTLALAHLKVNLDENKKRFEKVTQDAIQPFIQTQAKDTTASEEITTLLKIRNEISDAIRGNNAIRSDAERDLSRNRDFIIGNQFIEQVDAKLKIDFMPNADKIKSFYQALKQMQININDEIKFKAEYEPDYDLTSLKTLLSITEKNISKLENKDPALAQDLAIKQTLVQHEKDTAAKRAQYVNTNKLTKGKEKQEQLNQWIKEIKKTNPHLQTQAEKQFNEGTIKQRSVQLIEMLIKKLDKLDQGTAKLQYHPSNLSLQQQTSGQTILEIRQTFRNDITKFLKKLQTLQIGHPDANSQLTALKTELLQMQQTLPEVKTTHKILRLFAIRTPQEKLADLIKDGLKSIAQLEKKLGVTLETANPPEQTSAPQPKK